MKLNPNDLNFLDSGFFNYKDDNLIALIGSIKECGQLMPVSVFEFEGKWYYESGRRRVEACKQLGIDVECYKLHPTETLKEAKIKHYESWSTKIKSLRN